MDFLMLTTLVLIVLNNNIYLSSARIPFKSWIQLLFLSHLNRRFRVAVAWWLLHLLYRTRLPLLLVCLS